MPKNVFKIVSALGIIALLTSCTSIKSKENTIQQVDKTLINQTTRQEEKIIENQTVNLKLNEVKNSKIPNFEEICKDTLEIDLTSDSRGMYKSIKIKDLKIISDILTMIGKSQLITDESKIKYLNEGASDKGKLVLIEKKGMKKEISFSFKDPAFAVGALEIDGKRYDPGFSFFRYIKDFSEYNSFDTNIDNDVEQLFKKYDWTIDYKINTIKENLPDNLKHEAGEYPVKIYWAYNSELSKSIGLDFKSYLGKKMEMEIYRLREPLPDYMHPRMDARGVVLKYENKIIGAYIDAGRHNCFACSLDRKSLKDITNKEWDNWVSNYINYDNELEIKLSKMSPEQIIKQYYDSMNKKDTKTQFASMTLETLCNYLSMNMDNNQLINKSFEDGSLGGFTNVSSAKFINLKKMSNLGNPEGTVEYSVTVYLKFRKEITSGSGIQPRFIILKKESEKSGWRIQSVGTGP